MLKVKTIDYHIPEVKPQEKDNESLRKAVTKLSQILAACRRKA